jgi:dihydropteroate synthase
MKDSSFFNQITQSTSTLNIGGKILDLSEPKIMGIINTTPDSFYTESRVNQFDQVITKVSTMVDEGVDILDLGGQSTRPGAEILESDEELKRVVPVLREIKNAFPDLTISVDTFYASVAEKALNFGADIINDVSGGNHDPRMFDLIGDSKVPYVLMHSRGNSQTMTSLNNYKALEKEIISELIQKKDKLLQKGAKDIIIDPGFGFAKNPEQGFRLLNNLDVFKILQSPILVGISRKSMIWKTLKSDSSSALNGTTVLNTIALMKGANILRVHDVKPAKEAVILVGKTLTS